MTIAEGQSAPDFTLTDAAGCPVSLGDFRGRDVLLFFYPRDDTPGCTKEACGFRDLWSEIQDEGAVVLGISPDTATSHQEFIHKYALPFPLLCDTDKKVMTEYGAWGEKVLYGRTTQGVIRSSVWIGPDGEVKKHWRLVTRAAEHPSQVLAALRQDVEA